MDSEGNLHNAVSSPISLTEETIARTLTTLSLSNYTRPQLPTLPLDLISEILCRLPVKLLLQFRCVCKSWNSLITDPIFAGQHLRLSTKLLVHTSTYSYLSHLPSMYVLKSYPLNSVFTDVTTNHITQHEFPSDRYVYFVGSFNGIICLATDYGGFVTVELWNPSIRKFKELPSLGKQQNPYQVLMMYGFGYDAIFNDYKVVVILKHTDNFVDSHELKVHTLGTNVWKSIQKFPFDYDVRQPSGNFMHGTINWLVSSKNKNPPLIVSLDLKNESCKEISLPAGYGVDAYKYLQLGVLRDSLCIVIGHDVWVMKEHGNQDSWTKLFTISCMRNFNKCHATFKVLHMFEDGQVLLKYRKRLTWKLMFYNSRNGTFKFTKVENMFEVCIESLISPCS
ncbi:putative F-box domain-containing protein [Medicago truncatula]|uniref:F-box protein interaction domain protein n=1 Tax=Medicago truncatula TaxID=3880 RepID=A0A072UTE4_MEDTR|nr:F-box/kelch-repeat protein At3g23880 [Medicago truncatula]KEH32867.1 F-box protein interaction domain protein [Medicago truncatula]RHN65412.1 putative F-box domain-containing protein [Medicago truncatula]